MAGVSGSVVLASDYRFRGITLSDGLPALQLDLDWTAPQGWYAGAFASSVRLAPGRETSLQWLGYAGYARRINPDWNWDLGVDYAGFARDHQYDYPEIHFGMVSTPLQLRVHYARRYFGQRAAVWYAEADGMRELGDRWRLLAHVGILRREGMAIDSESRYRGDVRAGFGARFGAFDWQLVWVDSAGAASYAFGYPSTGTRQAMILSASREW